jgi:hypothetical protein
MPKLRFGLRFLLVLPVCVAAFYLGWARHAAQVRTEYERTAAAAEQRLSELQRELLQRHAARATTLKNSIDALEHSERMQRYQRLLSEPTGATAFPPGAF